MEHLESMLKLCDIELEAVERNGKFRNRDEIETVYKLADIVKDIYCVMDMEEGGYSGDGSYEGGSMRGSYEGGSMRGSYEGGMSGARGRGRGARRDSMGRYSREGSSYRDGSYRGYSRHEGKQEYIEQLHELMESAPDEQTRQSVQRMISQLEQG